MSRKAIYLSLALLGAAFPLWAFVPFLAQYGLDWELFLSQLWASEVSRFFSLDVVCSALALCFWTHFEARRLGDRSLYWGLGGLAVGVSLALPLVLYLREGSEN